MTTSTQPPDLPDDPHGLTDEVLDRILDRAATLAAGPDGATVVPDPLTAATDEVTGAPWRVESLGAAEWAIRKLAELEAEETAARQQHLEWTRPYDEWLDGQLARLRRPHTFLRSHLERYALAERDRTDGRVKSVNLPHGKISTTAAAARPVVTDPDAVVEWVEEWLSEAEAEAIVSHTVSVRVGELRKVAQVADVIDGWRIVTSCGEVHDPWPEEWLDASVADLTAPGHTFECPECAEQVHVVTAETIGYRLEVHDDAGRPIPGTAVEPASVTASVKVTK